MPVLKEQVARQGIAGITDREWRERAQENRVRPPVTACAPLSAKWELRFPLTSHPKKKLPLAKFAEGRRAGMSLGDVDAFAIPLAQSAGLAELEARWRYELMMEKGPNSTSCSRACIPLSNCNGDA